MTQNSFTPGLVSLVLASRGLAPTPAFVQEHVAQDPSPPERSLFARRSVAIRVIAIAVLLLAAAGASLNGDGADRAHGAGTHASV